MAAIVRASLRDKKLRFAMHGISKANAIKEPHA